MRSSILRTARRPLFAAHHYPHRCISNSAAKIDAAFVEPQAAELETPETLTEYPDVPTINRQYLPPKGWQDNQYRRNFGDPVRTLLLLRIPARHLMLLSVTRAR